MKRVKHVISWDSDSKTHEEHVNEAMQILHTSARSKGNNEANIVYMQHSVTAVNTESSSDVIFSTLITYVS